MKKNKIFTLLSVLGFCLLSLITSSCDMIFADSSGEEVVDEFQKLIDLYSEYNVKKEDFSFEKIDTIEFSNCSERIIVVNENVKGIVYTCATKGYAGDIIYQLAFANGNYLGYIDLCNFETPSYGGVLINNMSDIINGIPANETLKSNERYKEAICGVTVTSRELTGAFEACAEDYLKWYNSNK